MALNFGRFGLAMLAITGLAVAPAEARRVAVDDNGPIIDVGNCVLGASESKVPCSGYALGFKLRLATGTVKTAYVYDDGLVSLGQKVADFYPDYAGYSNFHDYITAASAGALLLAPSLSADRSGFGIRYSNVLASPPGTFKVEWAEYSTTSNSGRNYDICLNCKFNTMTIVSNPDGGATVTYDWTLDMVLDDHDWQGGKLYGSTFPGDLGLQPLFTVDNSQGYADVRPVPSYTFTILGIGLVPEPGTWAMMIAGFGLVGASMRRRERRTA